jgi:WhiB family redox-sensing transcriptional regulator
MFMTAVTAESLRWQGLAACTTADIDLLFGSDGETEDERAAREKQAKQQFCARCPVTADCLGHAIEGNVKHGVWGGQGEEERRAYRESAMRRARRRQQDGAAA